MDNSDSTTLKLTDDADTPSIRELYSTLSSIWWHYRKQVAIMISILVLFVLYKL